MPAGWGSLARRGARELARDDFGPDSTRGDRSLRERSPWGTGTSGRPPRKQAPERARRLGPDRPEGDGELDSEVGAEEEMAASERGSESFETTLVDTVPAVPRRRPAWPGPKESGGEPASRAEQPRSARQQRQTDLHEPKLVERLGDATRAYGADRYQDALRVLRVLVDRAPESASVHELLGLTLYRMGRWSAALKELEAYHALSGSYDQYPVMADCFRALKRYPDAGRVWQELREASPGAELMAEGRLVAAGVLADQGDLDGAVKLLESSLRRSKPKQLHLRQWYALADLYERAGELPRARDLFSQIAAVDPEAYDVGQRLRALG